jgi:uncharacterized protein YdhG (YjbR/CyaY superfamily)
MSNDGDPGFPKLSAPARRALSAAGYKNLDQLAEVSETDLNKLHGMGPNATATLRKALHAHGLSFRGSEPTTGPQARPGASAERVDEYLRALEEPKRSTLRTLRRTILEVIPDAEEVISYGVPAFRVQGKTVAGFAAFKTHLSYLPFSGAVLARLGDELEGYTMTKSSLHFPTDTPLPKALVKKLIAVRLDEIRSRSR